MTLDPHEVRSAWELQVAGLGYVTQFGKAPVPMKSTRRRRGKFCNIQEKGSVHINTLGSPNIQKD
ncbi:uncharacterized protein [Physcomitrium patens]|uniref:uncharacterized protein isoform X2 n=1 Tax=Physcomitrium patens TaxID=3218 RepID=UPI003CCCC289